LLIPQKSLTRKAPVFIPGLFLVQLDLYILQETIFQAQGQEENILFILDSGAC
jgi:hypothetical protein